MNLAIFGAVSLGPTLGGFQASALGWRPLFWAVAGVAALALLFALLTFEDQPPQDRSAPWDRVAMVLAGGGCGAAFFGASQLEVHESVDASSLAPLLAGALAVVALVIYEYRSRRPLMPIKQLATTFPVMGITIAIFASSAAFGLTELVLKAYEPHATPTQMALLFLPEFGAAVVMAALFGALFRTRCTPLLALARTTLLVAAAAVLTGVASGSPVLVGVGSGLIGLGIGASVSPALSSRASRCDRQIQRVFALIELLRGVSAFLVAPILIFLTGAIGATSKVAGIGPTVWICLGLAALGGLAALVIFRLGGARLQEPDLARWQEAGGAGVALTAAAGGDAPYVRRADCATGPERASREGEQRASRPQDRKAA
jgi:Major Facilitator Superfamily